LPDNVIPVRYDLEVVPAAADATFTAAVGIQIDVRHRTSDIELNSADLAFSSVRLSGAAASPTIRFDTSQQTVTLHFAAPVGAGRHTLTIRYSGQINAGPSGLFFLDYDTDAGSKRALFTEFENSDARRFFPCWDEPNRKATFTLTVTAPEADMTVSNMPAAQVTRLAGGLARTRFQTSPRMSTYLLFLAEGDFQRIARRVNGVELGVVYRRGDEAAAREALDRAAQLLPYYEDYFGVRYPLPKLDLVAAPGDSQSFEAMENWGAILGFDRDMLVDPATASQSDSINAYITIAHEMAHQWFGDLVTMDWWNDLWLNEGFAEWMQYKAMDHFHPQWQPWLLALAEREDAMDQDSRAGTHPVITPVADVLQANDDFDVITYTKGMAVIQMLENLLGEQPFRDGIRRYLRAHAYGNAISEDLWRELDRSATVPVSGIAHQFTLQAGVPLIRVTTNSGLHLEQGRFTTDASDGPTVWQVPVVVRSPTGAEWRGLISATAPVALPGFPDNGTVVNYGHQGYFRTLYAPALIAALSARFASLPPVDQLGLLQDAEALGMAGYEPLPDALKLAQEIGPDTQPQVQRTVVDMLFSLAQLYRGRREEPAFRAFVLPLLARLYAPVGLKSRPGEAPGVALVRGTLVNVLSYLDDDELLRETRQLYAGYRRDPTSLPADQRSLVLRVIAEHADATEWEQLHVMAKAARGAAEKASDYDLLGMALDPKLAQQALNLTLTAEIQTTTRPMVLNDVAELHPDMAFDFAVEHRDQVNDWLEPNARDDFQTRLLSGSIDPAAPDKLLAYVAAHLPASAQRPAAALASQIVYSIKVRNERLAQIDSWLNAAH
jgi:aminopeptidase N